MSKLQKLSKNFHSGQVRYLMKVTHKYRETFFSWGLLALMILLQAKLFSTEREIKNKWQELYGKEKKTTQLLLFWSSQMNLLEKSESISIFKTHNESSVLGFENNSGLAIFKPLKVAVFIKGFQQLRFKLLDILISMVTMSEELFS